MAEAVNLEVVGRPGGHHPIPLMRPWGVSGRCVAIVCLIILFAAFRVKGEGLGPVFFVSKGIEN